MAAFVFYSGAAFVGEEEADGCDVDFGGCEVEGVLGCLLATILHKMVNGMYLAGCAFDVYVGFFLQELFDDGVSFGVSQTSCDHEWGPTRSILSEA